MSSSNNSSSSEESLSTLITKALKEKKALAHELELIGVPAPVFRHEHDSPSGSITPMPLSPMHSSATSPLVSSVSSHNDDSDLDKDYIPGVQGEAVLSIPSSSSGSDIRPLKRSLKRKRQTSKPTRRSPRKHPASKAKRTSPRKPTRRSPRKHVQPTSEGT